MTERVTGPAGPVSGVPAVPSCNGPMTHPHEEAQCRDPFCLTGPLPHRAQPGCGRLRVEPLYECPRCGHTRADLDAAISEAVRRIVRDLERNEARDCADAVRLSAFSLDIEVADE